MKRSQRRGRTCSSNHCRLGAVVGICTGTSVWLGALWSYHATSTNHFGNFQDVAARSRERRRQHQQKKRRRPHVNFLDSKHRSSNKNDKTILHLGERDYRVADKTGMLQLVSPAIRAQEQENGATEDSSLGYAPTGGALPRPQNRVPLQFAHSSSSATSTLSVDQFTCIGNSSHVGVHDWQPRAPFVIVLGAMKAGTQALTTYLWQHPQFAKKDLGMEIHFFNNLDFVPADNLGRILVARNQEAYARRFQKSHSKLFEEVQQPPLVGNNKLLALDSTPYYLMGTDVIPQAICCVAPWAKLIALLRDPVERVESHYRYLHQARVRNDKPMVDWDVWIHADLNLLQETGVVRSGGAEFRVSHQEEFQAWKRYLHHPNNCQQVVGRGLYAIQLEHYLTVLDACPHKNRSDLLVVRSEDLRRNTRETYNEVLQFLHLPSHKLTNASLVHTTSADGEEEKRPSASPPPQPPPMPDHIREELRAFFRPYNQRLFKLLNWSPVWY